MRSTAWIPLTILVSTHPAAAQISAFSYDSSRVPVGRAYEYVKSNRDGTHATQVTVYVAAVDRLESLKWDSGGDARAHGQSEGSDPGREVRATIPTFMA